MAPEHNLADDLLATVTDAMVAESFGYREERPELLPELPGAAIASTPAPASWREAITQTAYDFIVRWETGGKAYYEQVIKCHPIWPGFASGITIGCGYDLGYHDLGEVRTQWGTRLSVGDLDQLEVAIGLKTTDPNRDQKVTQAKQMVQTFKDIVVPWVVALEQFENAKLPGIVRQLYGALDNLDQIHAHCRGALLSLVFNRGPSFRAQGDRYEEMRAISAAMTDGTRASFDLIPGYLRSMKRIWGADSGLGQRREGEAKLFEQGLAEMT